ncbi:Putative transport protein [Cronobacter sakazakii 701]|nr:Putative transport protein [Cronobacter sakazakii 701]
MASLVVSWLVATPLLSTTSVMLATVVLAGLGFRLRGRQRLTQSSAA